MVQASDGRFNESYTTYALPEVSGCEGREVMLSIRKDSVGRFLPAIEHLDPRPIQVPPPSP
jgi:hypothetical protein